MGGSFSQIEFQYSLPAASPALPRTDCSHWTDTAWSNNTDEDFTCYDLRSTHTNLRAGWVDSIPQTKTQRVRTQVYQSSQSDKCNDMNREQNPYSYKTDCHEATGGNRHRHGS